MELVIYIQLPSLVHVSYSR